MPLLTGARLGQYQILGAIGAGGMGEVYRARDTRLNRDVALKILPSGHVPPSMMAAAYWLGGQRDAAVAWLDRAYREHDSPVPSWNYFRAASTLYRHPLMRQLMVRLGLPPAPDVGTGAP